MRGVTDRESPNGVLIGVFFLVLVIVWAPAASAKVCSVPTLAYPSIQAAVDDAACTEIVLAAQEIVGSVDVNRSLVLDGDSSAATTIAGQLTVTGAGTEVTLQDLTVNGGGCLPVALDVGDGAQITGTEDVVVVNADGGECPIFKDGFELGATVAWSSAVG
jgi:hypothetical protein